jgi:spore maturation protein SpmB
MVRLFPEIPAGHPVFGHIFMNFSANMLGLDNAATPLGLKAMEGMQELNQKKDTATNAMIMFLVLNTSGLTIIPVGVMTYRAVAGAAQPTDVFCPILIATAIATLAGMVITSLYQHINLFNKAIMTFVIGICLVVSGVIWLGTQVDQETMNKWSTVVANVLLFSIIMAFIWAGIRKKINVYEAFIEGAKGGFETAVRIIPYLVAILVAIGVFRASGAMDFIVGGLGKLVEMCGGNADYVAALPTAIMKPLSGSGARGMMVDAMQQYGPDSFIARLSCIFQGATDTTFYILAVYFGSVGIRKTRHAVMAGLLTDICGVIAAIAVAAIFFG